MQGRLGRRRLRNDHLYQLLSYLQTRASQGSPARGGVLLYAESTAGPMRYDLRLNGHDLRVRTVPLQGAWSDVRGALVGLTEELEVAAEA